MQRNICPASVLKCIGVSDPWGHWAAGTSRSSPQTPPQPLLLHAVHFTSVWSVRNEELQKVVGQVWSDFFIRCLILEGLSGSSGEEARPFRQVLRPRADIQGEDMAWIFGDRLKRTSHQLPQSLTIPSAPWAFSMALFALL